MRVLLRLVLLMLLVAALVLAWMRTESLLLSSVLPKVPSYINTIEGTIYITDAKSAGIKVFPPGVSFGGLSGQLRPYQLTFADTPVSFSGETLSLSFKWPEIFKLFKAIWNQESVEIKGGVELLDFRFSPKSDVITKDSQPVLRGNFFSSSTCLLSNFRFSELAKLDGIASLLMQVKECFRLPSFEQPDGEHVSPPISTSQVSNSQILLPQISLNMIPVLLESDIPVLHFEDIKNSKGVSNPEISKINARLLYPIISSELKLLSEFPLLASYWLELRSQADKASRGVFGTDKSLEVPLSIAYFHFLLRSHLPREVSDLLLEELEELTPTTPPEYRRFALLGSLFFEKGIPKQKIFEKQFIKGLIQSNIRPEF